MTAGFGGRRGGGGERDAAAAVVEPAAVRRRLPRRQDEQRLGPAVVSAHVRHDTDHVRAADRLRPTTVSLPRARAHQTASVNHSVNCT